MAAKQNRTISLVASAALVLGALPAVLGLARAEAALPPAQDTSAFCTNVPEGYGDFADIEASIHRRTIRCLAFAEVANGKSATAFVPDEDVTRGQMASFIARAIDLANNLSEIDLADLPGPSTDHFADDDGSPHEASINRLASAGIIRGVTLDQFSPDAIVSRAQMATFINGTQRFLSGGTAPFTSVEDYFVDDSDSLHQDNINAIAAVGITQGADRVNYGPSSSVRRSNMATFIARYLAVLHANSVIAELPEAGPPTEPSNATLRFAPTELVRLVVGSGVDTVELTATGLPEGTYRVTLVADGNVTFDAGQYSFSDEGSTGRAAIGSTGAQIVKANGLAVSPTTSVGGLAAVAGAVTVDVQALAFGQMRAVIYPDDGVAGSGPALDGSRRPTVPFGITGRVDSFPPVASAGALGSAATVLLNDEEANVIVARIGTTDASYGYDDNDELYLETKDAPLTMADFERLLGPGDTLDGASTYASEPAGTSALILHNLAPAPPQAVVESASETGATITVSGLQPGATANVYLAADGASFAGSALRASSSTDVAPGTDGFQIEVTGLAATTSYEFYVTQTVGSEESLPAHTTPGPETTLVTASPGPPAVLSVSVQGGRPGNTVLIDFSEPVTALTGGAAKVAVVCVESLLGLPLKTTTRTGTAVGAPVDADTMAVTMNGNVPGTGTCKAGVGAGAFADGSGTPNPAKADIPVS